VAGSKPFSRRDIILDVIALLGGALFSLSLSPLDFWPLAFLSPIALYAVTRGGSVRRTILRFYLYNVGLFGVGVSWIFVPINEYGNASVPLSGILVLLFVLSYSLTCVLQAVLYARYFKRQGLLGAASFSGLWVLQEWFRSWFLTGFPWLFVGYGAMGTPLENIAPVAGVFGVSLVVVLIGTSLYLAVAHRSWQLLIPGFVLFLVSLSASHLTFTRYERTVSVSLIQGNIDQHLKWQPQNRGPIVDLYKQASETEWGRDLVVWPEAAITLFRERAANVLEDLDRLAAMSGTALVLGIPDRHESGGFQNTVIVLGNGEGQYVKRRLVPFGEYVPLEDYLRGVIGLFNLPMSHNMIGPDKQSPLIAGGNRLSLSICYEVVYPDLVRSSVESPDLLVTVSNDTWFGSSVGPWQHFQMARMRALENGRAMIRATNNGVTALVDYRGVVQARLPQFQAGILRGEVEVRSGLTPFSQFGSYPVLCFCLLLIGITYLRRDQ
jgi:apolipoprotein N-acyltransferase|tara:strand:+ start:435 stop:1916 length:1482 start_codon:yes stop_codon:yes gene_type:complete